MLFTYLVTYGGYVRGQLDWYEGNMKKIVLKSREDAVKLHFTHLLFKEMMLKLGKGSALYVKSLVVVY